MVDDGVDPMRFFLSADLLVPLRRRWHTRGRCLYRRGKSDRVQQHAQAFRGTFYQASKHQIRRGWRAARPSTSHFVRENQ